MDHLHSYLQHLLTSLNTAHIFENLQSAVQLFLSLLSNGNFAEISATAMTSFVLIAAAEIGDKSQLVCMSLASRHRPMPILLGAIAAFALLNTLATVFGVAIASWLPEYIVAAIVALLFACFGIHSLRVETEDENNAIKEKSGHSIFFTTFLLITVAEFGDKTQLAVVGLSSTAAPIAVWLGATAALALTSALGILAGRTFLQKVPLALLHKISGGIFLVLSTFAAYRAYMSYAG
ncbi:MAG: TMEM165/GDT1 family protein [Methylobacter sp.]|nr:TMEM165/GDT1 family protein [Methylobacter sp.]MDP2100336.1 TMEM165/GDT1 family protein [Methylobacter sp.]MDP2427138.1 TMEM165/GDT1 family protein [Methylobacter sp.]MDP3053693.1 TMEM165/GDT1 family protein [Methylobacter sp.]MDP3361098.1 TMEM165/GDT1 family protein [Methylobacter sp.]